METVKPTRPHRAWLVFAGICLYYFVAFGLIYSGFGLFLSSMSEDLGIPYVQLSATATVRVLAGMVTTAVIGLRLCQGKAAPVSVPDPAGAGGDHPAGVGVQRHVAVPAHFCGDGAVLRADAVRHRAHPAQPVVCRPCRPYHHRQRLRRGRGHRAVPAAVPGHQPLGLADGLPVHGAAGTAGDAAHRHVPAGLQPQGPGPCPHAKHRETGRRPHPIRPGPLRPACSTAPVWPHGAVLPHRRPLRRDVHPHIQRPVLQGLFPLAGEPVGERFSGGHHAAPAGPRPAQHPDGAAPGAVHHPSPHRPGSGGAGVPHPRPLPLPWWRWRCS